MGLQIVDYPGEGNHPPLVFNTNTDNPYPKNRAFYNVGETLKIVHTRAAYNVFREEATEADFLRAEARMLKEAFWQLTGKDKQIYQNLQDISLWLDSEGREDFDPFDEDNRQLLEQTKIIASEQIGDHLEEIDLQVDFLRKKPQFHDVNDPEVQERMDWGLTIFRRVMTLDAGRNSGNFNLLFTELTERENERERRLVRNEIFSTATRAAVEQEEAYLSKFLTKATIRTIDLERELHPDFQRVTMLRQEVAKTILGDIPKQH